MHNKLTYCSQCRRSKYTDHDGRRLLQCYAHVEAECDEHLTTNCTYATDCQLFLPEKAEYKSQKQWLLECWRCGVDPAEAAK